MTILRNNRIAPVALAALLTIAFAPAAWAECSDADKEKAKDCQAKMAEISDAIVKASGQESEVFCTRTELTAQLACFEHYCGKLAIWIGNECEMPEPEDEDNCFSLQCEGNIVRVGPGGGGGGGMSFR